MLTLRRLIRLFSGYPGFGRYPARPGLHRSDPSHHLPGPGRSIAALVTVGFVIMLAGWPFTGSVAAVTTADGFVYTISGTSATITDYTGSGGTVAIPAVISENGQPYSVSAIGPSAFYNDSSITAVNVPDSVMTIGANAFLSCTNLASITLGANVSSIGSNALNKTALMSLALPASVSSIGEQALTGCASLAAISVSAANLAFSSRDGVLFDHDAAILLQYPLARAGTAYTVPDGVTSIGSYAFKGNTRLQTVSLPVSLTAIRDRAFDTCSNLVSCPLPANLSSLGLAAFYDCRQLADVTVPGSVATVSADAFYNCQKLTSLTLEDGIRTIGDRAFRSCAALSAVIIPGSVTSIGSYAFYNTAKLSRIQLAGAPPTLGSLSFDTSVSGFVLLYRAGQSGYTNPWKTYPTAPYYLVRYDGNGQTEGQVPADPHGYRSQEQAIVLANTGGLTRSGYTLTGWNTAANGSGMAYTATDSLQVGDQDVTLYAQWTALASPGGAGSGQAAISAPQVQLASGTTAGSPETSLRFIATIDTLQLQEAGFVLSLQNPAPEVSGPHCQLRSTTQVYLAILADGARITAESLGGTYIVALTLNQIPHADFATDIYVRPFVRHIDGSLEYGTLKTFSVTTCLNLKNI